MRNQCPYCEKRICGAIFPNKKWLGMDLCPRKDKGQCPHCGCPIAFNSRYFWLWAIGWLSFMLGILIPSISNGIVPVTMALRICLFLLFVVSILVSLLGIDMFVKKST